MRATDQAASLRLIQGTGHVPTTRRERAIAVTGGKGGVGKSTIAVGLASAFVADGSDTLMIDADLGMADLNLLLGVAPPHSLLDALGGAPIDEVLVAAHGMHLLPAANGSFELATLGPLARARACALVEELRVRFDTVVLDIAAGIGHQQSAFTRAARDCVVVVNPEPLSMADSYACLKVLATEHGLDTAYVVPNRVTSRGQADDVVGRLTDLVARFLDLTLVAMPYVPADPAVIEAAHFGVPLVRHRPDAPAARAMRRLARALDAVTPPDQRLDSAQQFWRCQLVPAGGETP